MVFKLYLKHLLYSVFTKRNNIKFFLIFIILMLIQIYFIFNIFDEQKIIESAILSFSTDTNSPYRLFSNFPRASVFDKKSELSNFGIDYYRKVRNIHNLTNLQFYIAENQSEIDYSFIKDYDQGLNNLTEPETKYNYYSWNLINETIENKNLFYSIIGFLKNYDRVDLNNLPIDGYIDSLPFLLNEIFASSAYKNSTFHFQVFNYFKRLKTDNSFYFMKIYNDYFGYINTITKKIFDLSLYYISHLFIDILFQERKNNTFYALHIYEFSKVYHFLANLIPFFLIISINSFSTACLYHFMLKNTSLLYIFFMLITIQFCQYIYFYTLVNFLKENNALKIQIISLIIFLINSLFSKATEFSYLYIIFPPFFMTVLNNYFYESLIYYSQIDQIYIPEIAVFFISWIIILIVFLKFLIKINFCSRYVNKLNFEQDSILINVEILQDKNKYKCKEIKIKRNKINIITGDNHSGKSNILKQICNNIPHGKIFYLLTKGKGFLHNLSLKENIQFFKKLLNINKKQIDDVNKTKELLINRHENSFGNDSFYSRINDPLLKDENCGKNIQMLKLYFLINLLNDSTNDKEFIILDQPFNKLNKKEIHDLIEYLKLFDHTIIISSNYKPENIDIDIVFESKNIHYLSKEEALENDLVLSNQVVSDDNINFNNQVTSSIDSYLIEQNTTNHELKNNEAIKEKDQDLIKNTPSDDVPKSNNQVLSIDDRGLNDQIIYNDNLGDSLNKKEEISNEVKKLENRNKLKENTIEKIKIKSEVFEFLKYISIFLFIFICSCISFKYNSVILDNIDTTLDNQKFDMKYLKTKRINEPLDKVYISDKFNRNSDLYICMNQSINFLNSTENAKYLEEYFNKSIIFNEHAILLDLEVDHFENMDYFNIIIYSRPIDIFRNIQLSSIISDCLINNLNPKYKIKTTFDIRYLDNDLNMNQTIIVDIQLIFITLPYYLVLLSILDFNKDYKKNAIFYSSILIFILYLEYYIAGIHFNKSLLIPKLLLFTLCCNLLNYEIKKFFLGILLFNSFCFLLYFYYGLIYIFKINTFNEVFNWLMLILESFSPYNRILFYKPLAFTYMFIFAVKDPEADKIFENYRRFYSEKQKDLLVSVSISSIGIIFWIFIYFYLLRKKQLKKIIPKANIILKRSDEKFKFSKDTKVKNLINIYDDKNKILNFELVKNSVYSSLSYTMKNKILLSIIGWNYLFDENNKNDCVIKNKEEIEIHLDSYTIEKLIFA